MIKRVYRKVRFVGRDIQARIFIATIRKKIKKFKVFPLEDSRVLVVQGMFRSGTSLTCDVISSLGLDFGPEKFLIQPVGNAKKLNPKGFFEHYFFTSLSYYLHHVTKSKGDSPAKDGVIKNLSLEDINWEKFVYYNLVSINDPRVKWVYKIEMFRNLFNLGWEEFISENFSSPFGIKVPMLALYSKLMQELFPSSVFLVVFRNPNSVLKSVRSISSNSSYELYNRYNQSLLTLDVQLSKDKVAYFSYDKLIGDTDSTVDKLEAFIKSKFNVTSDADKAKSKIDVNLIRNSPTGEFEKMPEYISDLHNQLLKKAM